jgi:hypothetical protein
MRFELVIVLLSSTLAIVSCSKTTTPPSANASQAGVETSSTTSASPASQPVTEKAPTVKPKVDACALLTSNEIEPVQGEAVKETKLSGQSSGGFNMSQCFFTLPTFNNSISLLVAQKGEGAGAKDPRDFWRDTFHENKPGDKDKDRDRNKKRGEDEEEEHTPPQKITGIGDEAYWTGSRVGGALYVLKGNSYIRISIGGPADQATKIKKSKALAAKAIARL